MSITDGPDGLCYHAITFTPKIPQKCHTTVRSFERCRGTLFLRARTPRSPLASPQGGEEKKRVRLLVQVPKKGAYR